MQERRAYDRLEVDGTILFKAVGSKVHVKAYIENISFGGFRMFSREKLDKDSIIDFELSLPMLEQPLKGKGKVRHVVLPKENAAAVFSMGVEFQDMDKESILHAIKRAQIKLISDLMRKPPKAKPMEDIPI